jgi:hypothetical protein
MIPEVTDVGRIFKYDNNHSVPDGTIVFLSPIFFYPHILPDGNFFYTISGILTVDVKKYNPLREERIIVIGETI